MKLSKATVYLLLVLGSCISPFSIDSPFLEQIVVEGMITDQPGPYLVKIGRTQPVNGQLYKSKEVSGASVLMQDDAGNFELLTEQTPGKYYTNLFQGVIGRSYSITITTQDAAVYKSTAEKLQPVGDITSLDYEFVQHEPGTGRQISTTNGFNIFLDADVLPEQEGRVWWRWTGTFEIFTFPQLRTKLVTTRTGKNKIIPDPPPCSTYYVSPYDSTLVGPFHECTCCTCWVPQYNATPLISDPRFNISEAGHFNVAFIEANVRTFHIKYHLEVEQLSLSQSVYDFWKTVRTQGQSGSNLFQTPPARTPGNIAASSPNAPPVIGYFAASSIKKKVLVLDRTQIPYTLSPIDTIALKCTDTYKYATTVKPEFW